MKKPSKAKAKKDADNRKENAGEFCPVEILEPLEYDPLRSDYGVQHRAGIAGLLLQLQAMEILRAQAQSEKEKARYIIPKYWLARENRALYVHFTKATFESVMREKYRGSLVLRQYSKKMKEGEGRLLLEKIEIAKGKYIFKYNELRPAFEYFDAFSAPAAWQDHIRDSTWTSYFCIPTTQPASFKTKPEQDEVTDVTDLWEGLVKRKPVGLKKNYCLNTWTEGLKGDELTDKPERVLLLHFWAVASTLFTPTSLTIEKNQRGKLDCQTEYHKPVIVVPDVTHVGNFAKEFRRHLAMRDHLGPNKRRHTDLFISTPREAALRFFFTPQLAQAQVITQGTRGARGAEVYTFRPAGQQAIVASVFNDPLNDYSRDLLNEYGLLTREIKSLPYLALQVENLLAGRQWDDGFDRLTDKFPHELFIPREASKDSTGRLKGEARRMAQSIKADCKIHMEDKMSGETNLERTIYNIVHKYVHWRAYTKKGFSARDFEFTFDRLNDLRTKKSTDNPLSAKEQRWLKTAAEYIDAVQGVSEELFIRFRGRRDRKGFANLFAETFFRAFYNLSADKMKALGSFVEGDKWESAKRLVLMSISAAAAIDAPDTDEEIIAPSEATADDQQSKEEG